MEQMLRSPLRQATFRELSKFQAVERDFSFTFANSVSWKSISGAIHGLGIEEMRSLDAVEIWRDDKKYPGVYSALIRVVFQSDERTLLDTELAEWSSRIIAALEGLGGKLRS
jgi:phenylalanyl-tRNA synthetase beta chain